jgi:hypothetical protein
MSAKRVLATASLIALCGLLVTAECSIMVILILKENKGRYSSIIKSCSNNC